MSGLCHPKTMRKSNAYRGSGTLAGLITPSRRQQAPEFSKILPSAMAKLVAAGLFELHEGSYRITALGRQKLCQHESAELLEAIGA